MTQYIPATLPLLEKQWDKTITTHPGDIRWVKWKDEYISYNKTGMAITFLVVIDGEPVGETTLITSPRCLAVKGRPTLCDGRTVANVNAVRITKAHEGQGHISQLVKVVENYARRQGYSRLTIGASADNQRNNAIYRHWGYDEIVLTEQEGGEKVIYYRKNL
ncbi:MAG: GNAT family N-acetyltransferase [Oscillospiraceae bacterium]|nr:GNAT family N-acetyltransferase [Oscillospiraceae bacterium]